jgi:hypothetical protein
MVGTGPIRGPAVKLRLPALAIVIGISVSVIPMRSLASGATVVLSSTDTVSELIVERLPGRSSLAAMSLIENEFELNATVDSKIFERLEVIQLDEPITRIEANALVQQLVDSGKVALAEINEKRYVATDPGDVRLVTQCSKHHQQRTFLGTEQELIADLMGWFMPLIQDRYFVERIDS